jgi:hypothetical protein
MGDYIEFVYAAMLRAQRRSVGLRCHSLAHGGCGYERKRERSFVRNRQAPTDRPGRAPPSPPLLFCLRSFDKPYVIDAIRMDMQHACGTDLFAMCAHARTHARLRCAAH